MTSPTAWLRALAVLLVAAGLAGCLSMPNAGPVREVDDAGAEEAEAPADIVVRPPQPGESARDIVVHFLDAMEASPLSTTVAQEFLSQEASAAWDPALATIVYGTRSAPRGSTLSVTIDLDEAGRLDERGSWLGPLTAPQSQLDFPMVREDGEWRIAEAPNALIVRDAWFAQRFSQFSVYFFDPGGEVLVPEPVYLPKGDQLATYLVRDLVAGPSADLARVERGFFPPGTTVRPVTVGDRGRAEIALEGDPGQQNARDTELMLAQLTWTLRQVPGIFSLAVTFNDEPLRWEDGPVDVVPIDQWPEFDPTGTSAPSVPFALRDGRLASGTPDELRQVSGPFGREEQGLRSVAVDPRGVRVAGVGTGGDRVLVGPLEAEGAARVREVASGASDLLPPSWDLAGRLWLVDRRANGAVVSVLSKGRLRSVEIPGISGGRVRAFQVSRDGTRFVAVMVGETRDDLKQSRIQADASGPPSATPARTLPFGDQLPTRVRDLSWSSPTALLVLAPIAPGVQEVRALPVDGSPSSGLPGGSVVSGNQRRLAGSPVVGEPWYAVSVPRPSVVDSSGVEYVESLKGVDLSTLTYAG